jgi:hypothetical protein
VCHTPLLPGMVWTLAQNTKKVHSHCFSAEVRGTRAAAPPVFSVAPPVSSTEQEQTGGAATRVPQTRAPQTRAAAAPRLGAGVGLGCKCSGGRGE